MKVSTSRQSRKVTSPSKYLEVSFHHAPCSGRSLFRLAASSDSKRATTIASPALVTPAGAPSQPLAPGPMSSIHRSSWRRSPAASLHRPCITCTNIAAPSLALVSAPTLRRARSPSRGRGAKKESRADAHPPRPPEGPARSGGAADRGTPERRIRGGASPRSTQHPTEGADRGDDGGPRSEPAGRRVLLGQPLRHEPAGRVAARELRVHRCLRLRRRQVRLAGGWAPDRGTGIDHTAAGRV